MLAAEQLGVAPARAHRRAEFGADDWQRVGAIGNVRVAIALAEIGRDELSSKVLLHQARIGDAGDYAALSPPRPRAVPAGDPGVDGDQRPPRRRPRSLGALPRAATGCR